MTTDEDGSATISWAPGARIDQLWITARKPKHVPIFILWDGERRPIRLPASKELRLEPGTTMGGIVKDEAGQPVPGATVEVNGPPTESELPNYAFSIGTARTDEQGQWRLDVAPRDLAGISASVTHPGYRRSWATISHDLHSVTILTKGLTVTGQVVDAQGRPIKGARTVMGRDVWGSKHPTATTDERGAFSLENCPAGGTIVTVQANGFAPRIHDVTADERTPPVVVRMTEPGATVRGRVVDIAGKPVAGAFVAADTWRGNRSIHFRVDTDKDGRFEWRSAPKDVVLYDIGQDGYMASRGVPLTASDREQTVILYPKLVISGRVTDAVTGRPVPKFRVVQGRPIVGKNEIHWSEANGVDESGGRFTSQFDEPSDKLFVRVEAPGYRTADSRAFRPNEGRQTFDFVLQPTAALSGIVQLPDGTPAAGADVALATLGHHVSLQSGRFERDANVPRFTTAADGRFAFAAPEGKFLLIALSDAGFAEASSDEVAKSSKLVLQPWGRIEGGVRIGARAGADQEVAFLPTRPNRGGFFVFSYGYITRSDVRGRFAFNRVMPGPGTVSRVVISDLAGGGQMHSPCWPEPVEVKPGQAVEVKVGGKGRPVIGRLVLDGTPEMTVDWTRNEPVALQILPDKSEKSPRREYPVAANIDRDGRFRIEDVPTGRYELRVPVNAVRDPDPRVAASTIGRATMTITVPEIPGDRSNQPLDLGTITAKLDETLKAGDLAPDFTVRRIDGKDKGGPIKLSDHQGKLVLVVFWATWSRSSLSELIALKEVQAAFGGNPRFAMIGLACDHIVEPAEEYLRKNDLAWPQGFAGNWGAEVGSSYKIRAMPETFLIGPDGRVLAKNLRGAALKEAIARALKDFGGKG